MPDVETILIRLGQHIQNARGMRRLTAYSCARIFGASRAKLAAIESGDPSMPIDEYFDALAALAGEGKNGRVSVRLRRAGADHISRRHRALEGQVSAGSRDARTLVAIPAAWARKARVTFPRDAFGKPKPW